MKVVFKSQEVEAALKRKGFKFEKGKKERFYRYYDLDGKRCGFKTHVSHGKKDIANKMIDFMADQVNLDRKQFIRLIECPLLREEYNKILIEKGIIK